MKQIDERESAGLVAARKALRLRKGPPEDDRRVSTLPGKTRVLPGQSALLPDEKAAR